MSVAKDEAEDGPDLSYDETSRDNDSLAAFDKNKRISTDEVSELKLPIANGISDEDHVNQRSNSIGASQLEQGRPSSADGSLSIPDDTPSLQVSEDPRGRYVPR